MAQYMCCAIPSPIVLIASGLPVCLAGIILQAFSWDASTQDAGGAIEQRIHGRTGSETNLQVRQAFLLFPTREATQAGLYPFSWCCVGSNIIPPPGGACYREAGHPVHKG